MSQIYFDVERKEWRAIFKGENPYLLCLECTFHDECDPVNYPMESYCNRKATQDEIDTHIEAIKEYLEVKNGQL